MPQLDGIGTVGQVLDLMMPNVVSCAFHSLRVPLAGAHGPFPLSDDTTVAAISVTREQLDFGEWTIIGSQPVALAQKDWPNENCRSQRWIGAQMYDAAVAEDLLNALNGLLPWDDWHDPLFLDSLLVNPDRKPPHVRYKTPPETGV